VTLVLGAVLLAALQAASAAPSPSPSPSPASARPVSDSVDRVVERMEAERANPCLAANREGKPCFPVTTFLSGPEYSVRQSLGLPADKWKPTPGGAPSTAEMKPYRPGGKTVVAPVVGFDPGCLVKGIIKNLKGKNDVYYLYRVHDIHGVRVAMYDRKVEPTTFQGDLEFLGRFTGECSALAAYRHEEAKIAPSGPPLPPRSSPQASPTPP
jgi:hypothetical protein